MEYLHYKGFIGNVEKSKTKSEGLCGKVLGLDRETYIRFEGENLADLQEHFEAIVDDLLAQQEKK